MDDNCIQYKNDIKDWDCTSSDLNNKSFNNEKFDPIKFNEFVNEKFSFQEVPENNLTIQQMFVPRYTNIYHMNENTFGNTLVYHSVGSGKTCTSIIIGETYRAAFQKNKPFPQIIVSTPSSIRESFINELLGSKTFTCNKQLKRSNFGSNPVENYNKESAYREIDKIEQEKLKNNWDIITHNKLITSLFEDEQQLHFKHGPISKRLNEGGNLIIIDEIQNLISDFGKNYEKLSFALQNFGKKNRIVLLTATPIYDKPFEIGLIMNLLNPRIYFPLSNTLFDKTFENNKNLFKYMTSGYVSYFGGDPSHFPKKRIIFQYHNLGKEQIDYLNNPKSNKGLQQQQYYNIVRPSSVSNYDNLKDYGKKIWDILESVKKQKGKIFIYSDMLKHGLFPIRKFLESELKYKEYNNRKNNKTLQYILWTGKSDTKIQNDLLEIFNSDNNINGNIIKVILGSTSIMEGVSLKAVKHVHILNPWWNESRIEQVIGRAVRQHSHTALSKNEQFVNIYRHLSIGKSKNEDYEKYVQNKSDEKKKKSSIFERWLKEVAVDCKIYSDHKKITTEEHYKQDKPDSETYTKYIFNPSSRVLTPNGKAYINDFDSIPNSNTIDENIICSVEPVEKIPDELTKLTYKISTIGPQIANQLLGEDINRLEFIRKFVNCLQESNIQILNKNISGINKDIEKRNNIIQTLICSKPERDKRVLERMLMKLTLKELEYHFPNS